MANSIDNNFINPSDHQWEKKREKSRKLIILSNLYLSLFQGPRGVGGFTWKRVKFINYYVR